MFKLQMKIKLELYQSNQLFFLLNLLAVYVDGIVLSTCNNEAEIVET